MSRILKAANIIVDNDCKVNISVMDPSSFMQKDVPQSEITDDQQDASEQPDEVTPEAIVNKAKDEAEQIKEKASQVAQTILDDAKVNAEVIAQGIFEEHKTKGYADGYKQGLNEAESIKAQAQETLNNAINEREEMLRTAEPEMVTLIGDIVNKLLSVETKVNPNVIVNLIKQGIAGATLNGDINIHVSSDDYDEVTKNKDEILSCLDMSSKLEIVKDPSLHKSDCIIETPYGNIDCSLDQQLSMLKRDLQYILESQIQ